MKCNNSDLQAAMGNSPSDTRVFRSIASKPRSIDFSNVTLGDGSTRGPPSFEGRMTQTDFLLDHQWTTVGEGTFMETGTNGRHVYSAIIGPDLSVRTRYATVPQDNATTQVFRTPSQDEPSANAESDNKSIFSFCVGIDSLRGGFGTVPYGNRELEAVRFVKQHFGLIYPDHHRHIETLRSIERSTELAQNIGASFMKHIKERKMCKPGNTVAAVVAVVEACRTGCREPFHTERAGKYLGRAISECVEGLQHGERGKLLPGSYTEVEALSRWMITYITVWYDSMDVDKKINIRKALTGKA
jgi:hypothetical protein